MRRIQAGTHLTLWLNDSPFSPIQEPEYILEHSVPARPTIHLQARHAALYYTGGHENSNVIGADFSPNDSDQLTIRIPIGGRSDHFVGLYENYATMIMAELVIAAYLGRAPIAELGAGILDFNRTCIGITDSRGYFKYPSQAIWLLTLLSHNAQNRSDEEVVRQMYRVDGIGLSEMDKDMVKPLLRALEDEALYVRKRALDLLGAVKSQDAVPVLLDKFQRDPTITGEIASTLAAIGDRRAVQPLIVALDDNTLTSQAKRHIIHALGELGDEQAIEPLLQHFQAVATLSNNDPDWQRHIQSLLGALQVFKDKRVVSVLMAFAEQVTDRRIRTLTFGTLAEIGDTTAVPLLLRFAAHTDSPTRYRAIRALAQIGDTSAVSPLIALLRQQPDKETASAIVNALGSMKNMSAWNVLVNLARKETDSELCTAVVDSLVALNPEQAEPVLMSLLENGSAEQQLAASGALADIPNVEIVQVLANRLPGLPENVRKAIVRKWASNLHAVSTLIARLQNENEYEDVRFEAANALGKLKARDAVPCLLSLLDHANTSLVARAIDALGNIGDPRAIPKLIEKLYDDRLGAYYLGYTVYNWADSALREFGTPECVQAINEAFRKRNNLDGQAEKPSVSGKD